MQTKVPYTISGNYRLGDIRHCFADVQKINSLLGFIPKVSFEEGVQKFVYWVNQQNTLLICMKNH
jgi:dTDP-L-rhamnose 4-epimerase